MIEETILPNKLRVLTKTLPSATSAVAAFVNVGSRSETAANSGVAHFLEHMAFKGTSRRSAHDISVEIEKLGASTNAATSVSETVYYVAGLPEHAPVAIDILGDVLTDSKYQAADVDIERNVILQEISQYEDNPFAVMAHLSTATAFPDQPVGRPTLGSRAFVQEARPQDFRDFIGANYSSETMLLVAAGGIEHARVADLAAAAFAKVPVTSPRAPLVPATYVGGLAIDRGKSFSQVNVGISLKSVPMRDKARYAHAMLAIALGGGMSSPLFTEVRKKRGLVYHAAAQSMFGADFGVISIVAMLTPANLNEFLRVACAELAKLCDTVQQDDLIRARNMLLVQMAYTQESASNMAGYMARSFFQHGHVRGFDEIRAEIEAVTVDDLQAAARTLLESRPTIALVGPVPDADYEGMVRAAFGG